VWGEDSVVSVGTVEDVDSLSESSESLHSIGIGCWLIPRSTDLFRFLVGASLPLFFRFSMFGFAVVSIWKALLQLKILYCSGVCMWDRLLMAVRNVNVSPMVEEV